jgi:serine/threonine protein phosphatase PrpC
MPQLSFVTTVGSTADVRASRADVMLVTEPDTGATLRTKGRLYLLFEASPPGPAEKIAREIAELTKQEYYYDLSAGIEVSLRRALRQANRRAAQRLRENRGGVTLQCACAVVVNNELYTSRVGGAQVFLVRRARLFLPGDQPGELADFVHRTTTREATSLGADADVLPKVWRQSIEAGDTVILASAGLVEGLGPEALKNAAVTLHPRSAAAHIHNRAIADDVAGSDAAIFIEIAQSTGAAARLAPEPPPILRPEDVAMADNIRSRLDWLGRIPRSIGRLLRGATTPVTAAATKSVSVGLELMPKRGAALPRHPDTARSRSRRQRRAMTSLAVMLLVAATGVGALAYRDYESTRASRDYQLAIINAEDFIASAHRLAERTQPDFDAARERLAGATEKLDEAERSPFAVPEKIATLRADVTALADQMDGVIIDLARFAPGTKLAQVVGNVNGLFVTDTGEGRLWRVFGDPIAQETLLQRGVKGPAANPVQISLQDVAVYILDDAKKLWRATTQLDDVTPGDSAKWKTPVAFSVFTDNLYVLDSESGQLWKHESNEGEQFREGTPYLTTPFAPNTARSLAVDGDVWIVTSTGELQRFRRNPLVTTAARIEFVPRWEGTAPRANAVQAIDAQRSIYLLDSGGKLVVQLTRDGRELARFALPPNLPPASGFYVSESLQVAYTLHGTKIVATSIAR